MFNRDGYTCHSCGRTAWGVYAESNKKRTLRFEIDHKVPRLLASDDFNAENLVITCRSCNSIKGQMDMSRFQKELESLALAVIQKRRLDGTV